MIDLFILNVRLYLLIDCFLNFATLICSKIDGLLYNILNFEL